MSRAGESADLQNEPDSSSVSIARFDPTALAFSGLCCSERHSNNAGRAGGTGGFACRFEKDGPAEPPVPRCWTIPQGGIPVIFRRVSVATGFYRLGKRAAVAPEMLLRIWV